MRTIRPSNPAFFSSSVSIFSCILPVSSSAEQVRKPGRMKKPHLPAPIPGHPARQSGLRTENNSARAPFPSAGFPFRRLITSKNTLFFAICQLRPSKFHLSEQIIRRNAPFSAVFRRFDGIGIFSRQGDGDHGFHSPVPTRTFGIMAAANRSIFLREKSVTLLCMRVIEAARQHGQPMIDKNTRLSPGAISLLGQGTAYCALCGASAVLMLRSSM